ncbi:MAG: hypothetical protein COB77_07625 [Gammaproteobacteria bacterium]|nr:MAG: hypothetical protein COB77_07625 [Gammaproteobacteria bacterium]
MKHKKIRNHLPVLPLRAITIIAIFICSGYITSSAATEQAQSKRIEVYSLSQNYWDTRYGDTLGNIVHHLLPNNPSKREALQHDIVLLNPDAFIEGDAERLRANKRLALPGYMQQADTRVNPATTIVERYSWGNIKRPIR